jgi:ABC-type phosphonate transport system ATPase subunit
VIEVRGLTKRYGGAVAVDRLSFDVPPGRSARAHLAALAAGNAIRQSRVDEGSSQDTPEISNRTILT